MKISRNLSFVFVLAVKQGIAQHKPPEQLNVFNQGFIAGTGCNSIFLRNIVSSLYPTSRLGLLNIPIFKYNS